MFMRSTGEDAYFVASNSANGFYSYYPACFDAARVKHLYAVKGGPGTGKSRFLRDVASFGERIGWRGEYIYCSSDADSLDGVILTRGDACIALLDATAPHVYEPTRPGFREDIVNLGVFWDSEVLERQAERIECLNAQKSEAYRRVYRYLASAGMMSENRDALVKPFLRRDAIRAFARRLMNDVPSEKAFSERPALIRSIGMQGEVAFDTYFAFARKIRLIEDCRDSAQYLLEELRQLAIERKLSIRVSHDPITPGKLDGLFLCKSGIAFAVIPKELCDYPFKRIHMRRFVNVSEMKSVRRETNLMRQTDRAMREGALAALAEVRRVHFQLEEIYGAAMNFSAKENFTKIFCRELFDLQKKREDGIINKE